MKRLLLVLSVCFMVVVHVIAQEKTITGRILDEAGEPIFSATIAVPGTSIGTISDFDGNFTLAVPEDATLSIAFVGFVPLISWMEISIRPIMWSGCPEDLSFLILWYLGVN